MRCADFCKPVFDCHSVIFASRSRGCGQFSAPDRLAAVIGRGRLSKAVRELPRSSGFSRAFAGRFAKNVRRANSAHAGFRTDDGSGLSDEARRARGRRQFSGNDGRRSAAARQHFLLRGNASILSESPARKLGGMEPAPFEHALPDAPSRAGLSMEQVRASQIEMGAWFSG